jgi:crotonobetainyl-CoA:carnitine CoA-transferase CaiB-like acyl-CoA transferase
MSDLLTGVRALELAVLLNGDTVGMHLGDLGADVIKVEAPPHGDYLRYFLGQLTPGVSAAHAQVNKNKRSVLLDLTDAADREVFLRLVDTADIVVDGFLPGTCDRLGLGPDQLTARKPSIVYVQHTGFGATGPYAPIPTHGMLMGALAGAHPLQVGADGRAIPREVTELGTESGGESTSVGALHATMHAIAAVVRARATGRGAVIDVAASDATVVTAWLATVLARNDRRITDRSGMPEMSGNALLGSRYQFYATADDRFVLFACIEQRFWDRWAKAIDRPDLVGRAGPGDNAEVYWGDATEWDELVPVFHTRTQAEWVALAADHRFALGPAPQGADEVAADAHVAGRNVFVEDGHPVAGAFSYVGSAAVVDGAPYLVRRHAPAPGEHTAEILAELQAGLPRQGR